MTGRSNLDHMDIEVVHAGTPEARVRQWHAVEVAAAERPEWPLPAMSFEELLGHVRYPGGEPISRYQALLAVEDDEVVGFAHSWWMSAQNSHLVDCSVHVLPEWRRRGIGRALLDRVAADARADGRRTLTLPGGPQGSIGEQFAIAAGAGHSLLERHSVLDLADVDRDLVDRSAPAAAGYRLESWGDVAPEELLPSLALAQESMDDAPKGTLDLARDTWTVDMLRALYSLSAARGYRRLVVAAVHDDTDEVAGFTELHIPPGKDEYGEQGDTVVVPAHRGHRLGMAMKSTMLQRLRTEAPHLTRISTWNAEENQWMLAVNVALGFRPAERWGMFQLTLG